MSAEMSNHEEVIEYLKWRRERMGPKRGEPLKSGDIIKVPDKSGDPEEGWRIEYIYPDNKNGIMMAKVTKEEVGKKIYPYQFLKKLIKK